MHGPTCERLKIRDQGGTVNSILVPSLVKGQTKEDIALDGCTKDEWRLGYIRNLQAPQVILNVLIASSNTSGTNCESAKCLQTATAYLAMNAGWISPNLMHLSQSC